MNKLKRWLGVFKSVTASFLGVQSQSQYEKDAEMSSFVPFLIVGLVMVVLFILTVWLLVNFLISSH